LGKDNEEIKAWEINGLYNKNGKYNYAEYIKCLEKIGLGKEKVKMDQMIFIDYIIGNTDRHLDNFGVIRNAQNLNCIKITPIFDFGNSLHHNTDMLDINYKEDINSVLFNKTHKENLRNIREYGWLDFNKLRDIPELVHDKLNEINNIAEERKGMIAGLLEHRIGMFEKSFAKK